MAFAYHITPLDETAPEGQDLTIHFKTKPEITPADRKEMQGLVLSEWGVAPDWEEWTKLNNCTEWAFVRSNGRLVAGCAIRIDALNTPFSQGNLPVVYTEHHIHVPELAALDIPDPFEALVECAMEEKIGPTWRLRNTVHMAFSMQPDRVEKYIRRGNRIYPHPSDRTKNREASAFAQEYVWYTLGADLKFIRPFVVDIPGEPLDITEAWSDAFPDPTPEAEALLTNSLVIFREGPRILLNPRRLLLCAVHTPSARLNLRMNRF